MRVRSTLVMVAALGAGSVAAAPVEASTGGYELVVIADSADGYLGQFGCPVLNNAGQAAFLARTIDGFSVLRGDGGALTTIAGPGLLNDLGGNYSINNSGEVAFYGGESDGRRVLYRGDGTFVQAVAETGKRFSWIEDVSINDASQVAFSAQLTGESPRTKDGLFWSKTLGHAHRVYTAKKDNFTGPPAAFHDAPSLQDDAVAFISGRKDLPAPGVYRRDQDGEVTTIAEAIGRMSNFAGVSMNDSGEVAFWVPLPDGHGAVQVGSGGPVRTVADTTSETFDYIAGYLPPSINNAGTVAFQATTDAGWGLFVGPDPDADRVAGSGDSVGGGTIDDVTACSESINDAGQLVFMADLVGRRNLIVRADPR